jgi:nickel-dependent lactate racemase
MKTEIQFGGHTLSLQVPAAKQVSVRQPTAAIDRANLPRLLGERLSSPTGFPALKLAVTPDDHIAIVLDPGLPQIETLLTGVLDHLAEGGIQHENVTLVVASEPTDPSWRDRLGMWKSKIAVEIHDPGDRDKLSYLAATQKGRRIYINRTVVDADQSVVLARSGYDWMQGYTGAAAAIFPALSDHATRTEFGALTEALVKDEGANGLLRDMEEAVWLLGAPFFVQVIEGVGDEIAEIVTGASESLQEGRRRVDAVWRLPGKSKAALVIAEVTGSAARLELRDLAAAAAKSTSLAETDGAVVLLFPGQIELDEAMQVLRSAGDPLEAARQLHRQKPANPAAALQWLAAVGRTHLYLLSPAEDEKVEEMLATPLEKLDQIQKLVDCASSVLMCRDPHKLVAGPAPLTGELASRKTRGQREGRTRR